MNYHSRRDLSAAQHAIFSASWIVSQDASGKLVIEGRPSIVEALSTLSRATANAGSLVLEALEGLVASSPPASHVYFERMDAQASPARAPSTTFRRALAGFLRWAIEGDQCRRALRKLAAGHRPGLVGTLEERSPGATIEEREVDLGVLLRGRASPHRERKPLPEEPTTDEVEPDDLIVAIRYMASRSWDYRAARPWAFQLRAGTHLQREIRSYRHASDTTGRARHVAGQALLRLARGVDEIAFHRLAHSPRTDGVAFRTFLEEVSAVMVLAVKARGAAGLQELVVDGVHSPIFGKAYQRRFNRREARASVA